MTATPLFKSKHPFARRLGRIKRTDFRDHRYLAIAPQSAPSVAIKTWTPPPVWDQGDTPMCVAFASLEFLVGGPVRNKQVTENETGAFYAECQAIDGDPGPHDGTTVRASMQTLQKRGFLTKYLWAYTVEDCANWIASIGPMVFGTDWLESMFDTSEYRRSMFINFDPNSQVAGGHSYLMYGVNRNKQCPDGSVGAFEMQNSWSPSWGHLGRAWMSFTAAKALLAESGEAACASEIVNKGGTP